MKSSLWDEPDWLVKIFVTMLALKDSDHIYRGNAYQLSRESRKSETEVLEALKILASPDTRRVEQQAFEGRRIKAVDDGWLVLNGELYRGMVSDEMKKARNRRAQAKFREKQRLAKQFPVSGAPQTGERVFVRTYENEGPEAADAQLARAQAGESEKAKVFPPPPAPVHSEQGNMAPYIGGVTEPEPEQEDNNGEPRFDHSTR